jgi:DNA-binding CsgD family transcriptional regulator
MPERGERGTTAAETAGFGTHDRNEEGEGLSAREEDVARMLAWGVSNKEIARTLDIEVVTVERHVGNNRAAGQGSRFRPGLSGSHTGEIGGVKRFANGPHGENVKIQAVRVAGA